MQQRAAAKNTAADQGDIAQRTDRCLHQVILTLNALIHHEGILRPQRQNKRSPKSEPL